MAVYFSFTLFVIFIVTVLLVRLNITEANFAKLFNFIKIFTIFISSLIFILVFIKLMTCLFATKIYGFYINYYRWMPKTFTPLPEPLILQLNTALLSDIIILLAFSSGLICIYLLGEKNLAKHVPNISVFAIFFVGIIFMVYTSNLLCMFLGFEFLFFPTVYFVYSHGYVKRSDKTLYILLLWTISGAFLVLTSISYLYMRYGTLNFYELAAIQFTKTEGIVLYLLIFIGFGVKVPLTPFHYWLTKIHVEAPAGFSIFLSGFLVKAAVYCFFFFNLIFKGHSISYLSTLVALVGIIEASVKMWNQTDLKKLIAFATIQEMNMIVFLLLNYQNTMQHSVLLFILFHGLLSALMFFFVDLIQKKRSSRNITLIGGLAYYFPELRTIAWIILLFYAGFPLTIKFILEWEFLATLSYESTPVLLIVFLAIIVLGVSGFAKQIMIVMYGFPRDMPETTYTLSHRDVYLVYFIISLLVLLTALHFYLC